MKLEGRRHRDTTQVKELSPEITRYVGGRYCSYSSRQNSHNHYWQGYASQTGSKTVSRCQKESMMNSGEPIGSRKDCTVKLIDGKIAQNMYRQSEEYDVGEYSELYPGEVCEGWTSDYIPTDWNAENIEIQIQLTLLPAS